MDCNEKKLMNSEKSGGFTKSSNLAKNRWDFARNYKNPKT